jgi:hypothetical protein
MSRPSLDWSNPEVVRAWLAGLQTSFDDLDAAASDMLRPPDERELGPALHRKHYADARAQILSALDYAAMPEPDVH